MQVQQRHPARQPIAQHKGRLMDQLTLTSCRYRVLRYKTVRRRPASCQTCRVYGSPWVRFLPILLFVALVGWLWTWRSRRDQQLASPCRAAEEHSIHQSVSCLEMVIYTYF